MPKISVGRDSEDREKYGLKGTGLIGKHLVGENEEAHKANSVYLDLARPHVVGVFGKRGTGKCLMPEQKVLTEDGLIEIEEFFSHARDYGQPEIREDDEELYYFSGPNVASVNQNCSMTENAIKAAYRKKVNEKLAKIKTRSGREITVTQEHPLFTTDGWRDAKEISEGQRIGIPRAINVSFGNSKLKIPEKFQKAKFSNLKKRESELLPEPDESKISEVSDGSGSFRKMVNQAEEDGLIEITQNSSSVPQKGQEELEKRKTQEHYRYGKSAPIKLPRTVTPELGKFMACLIGEGHEQKISENNYRIIFTNRNQSLRENFEQIGKNIFDLDFKHMREDSIYTDSKALEYFLSYNGYRTGENSFDKEIPDFILSSKKEVVSEFLKTFYECEGNVTDQQIELSSASKDIIDAINYMLLRFGIVGRISEKMKYASNTERKKVRKYFQITISGGKQLRKFQRDIGFISERKFSKLRSIIKESNTNVDTVPCGKILKKCRIQMGADRTQIAKHRQSLKAYEDGKYYPSREKLGEIVSNLENHLEKVKRLRNSLKEKPDIEKIEEFVDETAILWKNVNSECGYSRSDKRLLKYRKFHEKPSRLSEKVLKLFYSVHDLKASEKMLSKLKDLKNSDIHWDKVEEVEEINYKGWVYDLTVEEDHSFTAGFGGILCHNSYSLGTMIEELQAVDIKNNLSTIVVDPMGIYWSMTRPNDRGTSMLENWGMKPEGFDAKVYIPEGQTKHFNEEGMQYDDTFTLNPADFTAQEWAMALNIEMDSDRGILLERAINKLKDNLGRDYNLDDIIKAADKFDFEKETVRGLENRLTAAKDWGIFGEESSLEKFTTRGELSVIDVSVFGEMSSGWSVRSLVVGLLAKRILRRRMTARRVEEIEEMENIAENEMPIVWMFIDEAHEFLPADGKTPASDPLLRWVKIGREPGVSLVMATQQPAKLHSNALSQCDMVLSHRLTAKQDIEALGEIMQTYMRHDIKHYIDALPDRTGTGLILDDNSERIYPVQMRPRKSWHAGGTPDAFDE